MKQLLQHLLNNHLTEILDGSSANCHVQGLHSIMLLDSPGRSMRLYVVTPDHVIWQNGESGIPKTPMISGFHPHHSNIMLHCVSGIVVNRRATVLLGHDHTEDSHTRRLRCLRFDKAVEDKKIKNGFAEVGHDFVRVTHDEVLQRGDAVEMESKSLHTIFIPKGESAAWFVYNGPDDPGYVPYMWTNAALDRQETAGLYQPMSLELLMSLLRVANVLEDAGTGSNEGSLMYAK